MIAGMVRRQKLRYLENRCEDMDKALREIVQLYGDDTISDAQALERAFDIATQALTLGAWASERDARRV